MYAVVGEVSSNDQTNRRNMETGRVVGIRMTNIDDDQFVILQVQGVALERFGQYSPEGRGQYSLERCGQL